MTSVAVLVPRRSDGGRRDELWRFCRAWWEREHPTWEIIEGHHDDGGMFNRGAAVNAAASRTDADVLVIADGDIVIAPESVVAAVKVAAETGRAVLPYRRGDGYVPLTEQMTDRVLAGFDGNWTTGLSRGDRSPDHVSSCVVVPRSLWDRVGGFDERVEGWGPDDRIFHAKCRTLGGGVERLDGQVFHLWHPFSAERGNGGRTYRRRPSWQAGRALWDRVESLTKPVDLERFLVDAKAPDGVLVVFVGNGRKECLGRAIPSFAAALDGPVMRSMIVDDSGDLDHHAWIRLHFPDHELVVTGGRSGFAAVYAMVWWQIMAVGLPWAFVIEEDFTATRPIDLRVMQSAMVDNPHLVQMALRRQAWFPAELEAGGVVEQNPDAYTDTPTHLEHRLFTTTNPALWRRSFVAEHPWPQRPHSESIFAREVFAADPDVRSGYWGHRSDDPWVIHDGERIGSGY